MGIFVGITGILYSFASWKVGKKAFNPGVIFEVYWTIISLLSIMRLFGLQNVDNTIYCIVFWGETFFFLGFLTAFYNKKHFTFNIHRVNSHEISSKSMKIMFCFLFIALLIIDINVARLMLRGIAFREIRNIYINEVLNTYFMAVLYKFLIAPLVFAFIVATIVDIIFTREINRKWLLKATVLTIMEFFAMGDRMLLFLWAIGFGVAYIYLRHSVSIEFKKKLFKMILLVFFLMISVFWLRGVGAIRNTYYYMTGELIFFQNRLSNISDHTIFVSSFQGLLRPFMGILEKIGVQWNLYEMADVFLYENQYQAFEIAKVRNEPVYYNYFISCFGYFYKDLGYIGVFLYSYVWGYISTHIYKKSIGRLFDAYYLGFYIIIVLGITLGMMNFSFVEVTYSWGLIFYLIVFCKKSYSCNRCKATL